MIIWQDTFRLISEKFILAGEEVHSHIFKTVNPTDLNFQHIHNLPLELAFSYGIPSALIITLSLLFLTFKSFLINLNLNKKSKFIYSENIFDLAWKTSAAIFLISHLFDITYFDARISILVWTIFQESEIFLEMKLLRKVAYKNHN